MNVITNTTAINLFGPAVKRLSFAMFEGKLTSSIVPHSFPLFSNSMKDAQVSHRIEPSLVVQKKGISTEFYIRPGFLTDSHQNLLFRTTMKRRIYKNPIHQLQKRAYCTQGGTRDNIKAGPLAKVNTGNLVNINGVGMLINLFATIIGWAYCDAHPDKEICASIRTYFGIKKRINHIPFTCSHHSSRKAPRERIQKLFFEGHPVVAIIGDPASGKTELGKQYAREYKDKYHHIWFVQVETWERAYQDLAKEWKLFSDEEIAIAGGIEKVMMDLIIHKVHHSFTFFGRKNLIIFDNAPEGFIESQLKWQLPAQTDILFTSRSSNWEQKVNLSSDKNCILTLDEGVQILRNWIGDERLDFEEAKKIIQRFNYSPVPVAQAGSYLYKTKQAIEKYLPLFEQNKQEILKGGMLKGDIDIIVSLKIAMDQVNPDALKLLHYCAFLPAKNIPREFLEKLFGLRELNEYISALDTLILADTTTVSIHDLFQEIIAEQMSSQKKELLSKLGQASNGFEKFLLKDPKKALPIFQQSLEDNELKTSTDEGKIAYISNLLGMIYYSLGDYQSSFFHYNQSLIHEKILGKEHLDTARNNNNVGASLLALGRNGEALECLKKSLEIREQLFGKEHLATAMSYGSIGVGLSALGRHEEALEYEKKVLEIREKVLGKEHPDTAMSYNNVGMNLWALGRHEEALENLQQAVQISCKIYQKKHPDHGIYIKNFALHLDQHSDRKLCEKLKQETLPLCIEKFGKDDPFVRLLQEACSK